MQGSHSLTFNFECTKCKVISSVDTNKRVRLLLEPTGDTEDEDEEQPHAYFYARWAGRSWSYYRLIWVFVCAFFDAIFFVALIWSPFIPYC